MKFDPLFLAPLITIMESYITDLMPVIAPDNLTLAKKVLVFLKKGWRLSGPTKTMRPLHDPSTIVFVQWVVLPAN